MPLSGRLARFIPCSFSEKSFYCHHRTSKSGMTRSNCSPRRRRNPPIKEILNHRQNSAGEIAEAVGEVAVVAGDEGVVAEIAVLAEDDVAKKEIAERVHAEHIDDGAREDDVAFGLAHFGGVHEEPAVGPDLFRDREHGGHQEGGPIDGVKTDDVFADEVKVGGPVAAPFVSGAADGAEIGGERVEPDVKDVRLFTGDGNAPANGGAGDAETFQTAFDEADDFVATSFWLDETGILFVKIEQRLLE